MIRPEHQFYIRPDLRKAASTKAESAIRPKQLVRISTSYCKLHINAPFRHVRFPGKISFRDFSSASKMDFKFGNSISGFLYSYLVLLLTYTEVNTFYFRIYFGLFVYCTSCELYNFTYEIRVWRYQGVNRIRKSKKDRQCNGQKKKDKQRSAKHTHKTKDRVTRTRLKPGVDSGAPEMWEVFKSTFRRQTNHYVQIIWPPKDTVEKQRTTDWVTQTPLKTTGACYDPPTPLVL
jgi:hypothetical protein